MRLRSIFAALAVFASSGEALAACDKFDLVEYNPIFYTYEKWGCGSKIEYFSVDLLPGWSNHVANAAGNWVFAGTTISIRLGGSQGNAAWAPASWIPSGKDSAGAWVEKSYAYPNGVPVITSFVTRVNYINFPASEWTTTPPAPNKIPVMTVLRHEWGHGVGLRDDSLCVGDLMEGKVVRGDADLSTSQVDEEAFRFLYECTTANFLSVLGSEVCTCYSGGPDAAVQSFRCLDEVASWYTIFEDGTAEYHVEAAPSPSGPWHTAGADFPNIGEHSIPIRLGSGDAFVRLVELETEGGRVTRGLDRAWTTEGANRARAKVKHQRPPELPGAGTRAPAVACIDSAAAADYVIFTTEALRPTVECTIGVLRQSQGHAVQVIDVDANSQGETNDFIRATIQEYHATFGTKCFHIVGTWQDEFTSAIWESSDYWLAKRDAYQRSRARFERPNMTGAIIPPVLVSADAAPPTAVSTPYVYSDQPYGDVDDDGVPDVVVTRWPFGTTEQVQAAYYKLEEFDAFPKAARALFLGSDFNLVGYEANLVHAIIDTCAVELMQVVPESETSDLYLSDIDVEDWSTDTADRINSELPDVVFIVGHRSNSYEPGNFFSKQNAVPWQMDMLSPFVYTRLIVAASCNGADFEDVTQYGAPSCVDFLGEPYLGSMEWIGPTGSSIQAANALVTARLIEELYGSPYRPMAESWLVAMQRAYADVAVSSNYDDLVPTLQSYVFLGDPLTPLSPLPYHSIVAYARKPDGSMHEMPQEFAVGCPARDQDHLVVEVKLNAAQVVDGVAAEDLVLSQPIGSAESTAAFYPDGQTIIADSASVLFPPATGFPSGYYKTTFTVTSFGGCCADSALVSLQGIPLGYAQLNMRSVDLNIDNPTSPPTRALVTTNDFTRLASHVPSSTCNCIPVWPYEYWACVDFVPADTMIVNNDFTFFAEHFGHGDPTGGGNPSPASIATSSGTVRLEFEEEQPLIGQHLLKARVTLEGVEPFATVVLAVTNENPLFAYRGWEQSAAFTGKTLCTDVVRDGQRQVFLGVVPTEVTSAASVELGTVEFTVTSQQPVSLTEDDFALVTADVVEATTQRVLQMPLSGKAGRVMTLKHPTYHNQLAQNYPNPFNPKTTLAFSLAQAADVDFRIFDVTGAAVKTVLKGHRPAGVHRIEWDGRNDRGAPVASGVYFYKLVAGSFTDTKKMTILK
jgi:hypothetical protein